MKSPGNKESHRVSGKTRMPWSQLGYCQTEGTGESGFPIRGRKMHKKGYYYQLIQDLKILLSAYGAAEMPLDSRCDRLQCLLCGISHAPKERSFEEDSQPGLEPFIIIEIKQRKFFYKNRFVRLRIYTYICSNCGLWQTAIRKDSQENMT